MLIFGDFFKTQLIKRYTKTHQNAPYLKKFLREASITIVNIIIST